METLMVSAFLLQLALIIVTIKVLINAHKYKNKMKNDLKKAEEMCKELGYDFQIFKW